MRAWEVVGYTADADADVWCPGCFEAVGYEPEGEDYEGNPVHPIFAGDEGASEETCNACGGELL